MAREPENVNSACLRTNRAEITRANPHQVGHVLTSFGLTERKRTNTGWVLLLSRDTRKRIHTLLRRYAVETDSTVNREGCSLSTDRRTRRRMQANPPRNHGKPRSRMNRKSEEVNLVIFVHLKRNDQRLSFAYGQRCYL